MKHCLRNNYKSTQRNGEGNKGCPCENIEVLLCCVQADTVPEGKKLKLRAGDVGSRLQRDLKL